MKVRLVLVLPWWYRLYLKTLALFCWTFGTTPDKGKVNKFIIKHSSCRVERERV